MGSMGDGMLTSATRLPEAGTILRPIGWHGYGYCLRIRRDCGDGVAHCQRLGLRDDRRTPFDDGFTGRADDIWIDLEPTNVRGVYREPFDKRFGWSAGCPIYYRVADRDANGQSDLFGETA
jgi:hypothetical protein